MNSFVLNIIYISLKLFYNLWDEQSNFAIRVVQFARRWEMQSEGERQRILNKFNKMIIKLYLWRRSRVMRTTILKFVLLFLLSYANSIYFYYSSPLQYLNCFLCFQVRHSQNKSLLHCDVRKREGESATNLKNKSNTV